MKALLFRRNEVRYAAAMLTSRLAPGEGARFGPLSLADVDVPELPAEGWHHVTPLLSGICASDLATIDGHASRYFEPLVSFPFVPGHEVVGRLEDGQRVVLEPVLGPEARGFAPPFPDAVTGRRRRLRPPHRPAAGAGHPGRLLRVDRRRLVHPLRGAPLPAAPRSGRDERRGRGDGRAGRGRRPRRAAGGAGGGLHRRRGGGGHHGPALRGRAPPPAPGGARHRGRQAPPPARAGGQARRRPGGRPGAAAPLGAPRGRLPHDRRRPLRWGRRHHRHPRQLGIDPPLDRPHPPTRPGRAARACRRRCTSSSPRCGTGRPSWSAPTPTAARRLADGERTTSFRLALELAAAADLGALVSARYPLDRYVDAIRHAANAGSRQSVKVVFDLRGERHRP